MGKRKALDGELAALRTAVAALEPLDARARGRALGWLLGKFRQDGGIDEGAMRNVAGKERGDG